MLDEDVDDEDDGAFGAVGRFGGRRGTREIFTRRKVVSFDCEFVFVGRTRFCVERDFVMVFDADSGRVSVGRAEGARRV